MERDKEEFIDGQDGFDIFQLFFEKLSILSGFVAAKIWAQIGLSTLQKQDVPRLLLLIECKIYVGQHSDNWHKSSWFRRMKSLGV